MIKKNLAPIFALILIIIFFIQPNIVRAGAINGIILWYSKILPFLFPMFILSNILLQYNFLYDILEKISVVSKKVLGSAFAIIPFIISIISGYPSGALVTDLIVKSNRITESEGNYLLAFTNLCSFQFISAVVVLSMLKDISLLIYIIIPHYVGAIVLSKFLKKDFSYIRLSKKESFIKHISFNEAFNNAISKSILSILTIAGIIVIFSIISEYFMSIVSISNGSSVLNIFVSLIIGMLELTNGCNIICSSLLPIEVKLILLNFLISFAGCSIVFQTITVTSKLDINILEYLKVKFVHGIISSLILIIMLIIL